MVDENVEGATLTAITTENATSVTVDDDERFEVADGNLKLKDDMSLDFEGDDGGSVVVTITASGDGDSATHTVTVTINDVNEAPSIDVRDGEEVPQKGVTSSLTIDEAVTGADIPPLALIEVMDPDAADATTGQAAADMVTLSGDMADYFEVKLDPEDGLWLALKADASLDYETVGDSVMVTVTYTDSAGQSVGVDVTVTVNGVNEPAEVNGEVDDMAFVGGEESSMDVDLGALFTDPDGDTLTYRLSDNAPEWLTFSVTTTGSAVTATLSGTPAAAAEGTIEGVSIIASDDDGLEAHAMFDLIIDAENEAPDRLELRVTDEDGLIVRTTEVNVDENAAGVELGSIYVRDPDDAGHPHGQHEFSFMVDGAADDRFEVADGMLKLMAGASLDREEDGSEITLTVTATDMGDPGLSRSLDITIMIGNVDTGTSEGPYVVEDAEIEAVTITVDEDLEEDDVDEGDWLSATPKGISTAFDDADGDTLTYSLGSGAPRWLQMDEDTGKLTNAEAMLPRRGVYEITVVASDDDGNTAEASFVIAVAISDAGDEDNDEPDIRNVDEIGYTEGDDSGAVVATFEVRDDDIEIDPHPYGVHEVTFTAMQDPGDGTDHIDVRGAFKIVRVGDDGSDTADYEIVAKTAEELAEGFNWDDKNNGEDVDLDKDGNVIPVDPIDYEKGDEINFEIMVTDGADDEDDRSISIDVEDAPDESPVFQVSAVPGGNGGKRDEMTTTVSVGQQQERTVIILQLQDLWEDADTDDDDLDFDVGGTDDLPDWIKVYGPDRWEDIYENRRNDVMEEDGDGVTGLRDRDEVVVIVMDRSAADGENVSLDGGSFTISADDGDNDAVAETIMISVTNTNVDPADPTKVVSISGGDPNKDKEVTGTGNLTMNVNFALDPDLASGEQPYLVLYTWMVSTGVADDTGTDEDESMTTISVSTTNEPLALGEGAPGMMTRKTDYVDQTITAKVEIFEVVPGGMVSKATYMATVNTADAGEAPVTPPTPTSVTFSDLLTDTTGLSLSITANGEAAEAGTAQLQSSTNGTSGWINVDSATADTSTGPAAVTLDVNADGDDTAGDGGGLYYRVVYTYDDDGDDVMEYSDVIQLGDVSTDPADIGLLGPAAPASGDTVRVDKQTANVAVQWQAGMDTDTSGTIDADEWEDLDGETGLELTLTDDHAGKSVRALLTHMGDEDNPSHVTWVDYSAEDAVAALPTSPNNTPTRNQAEYEIRVNLGDDEGMGTGSVAGLFFDSDQDDLTYSLVGDSVDDGAAGIQPGDTVYRTADDDQILTLNKETGAITYYTSNTMSHGSNTADDGVGNVFTVSVEASDGKSDTADDDTDDITINVRVNVAPTAIDLGGADLGSDAASATDSGVSFDETDDYDGTVSFDLNVQDLNLTTDPFGMHDVVVDDKRFEVESNEAGTTWTVTVKDGAEFDYEDDEADNQMGGVITLKITATDKGGKKVDGYITVALNDVGTDTSNGEGNENTEDPQYEEPSGSGADSGGVMTTGAGSDGPGDPPAPGDGGLWVEEQHFFDLDLLDEFVISIDDVDIA